MSDEPNKLADETLAGPDDAAAELQAPEPPVSDESSLDAESAVAGSAVAGDDNSLAADPEELPAADEPTVDEPAADEPAVDEPAADEPAADEQSGDAAADPVPPSPAVAGGSAAPEEVKMDWYILKVQSNREKSIAAALKRKIAIEGLEDYFGDVVVPMEKVTEFKGGKKKVVERKLYPGYIVVHMLINDDTWFAVRETSGIGDFTGSGGKPTPMLPHEVTRIVQTEEEIEEEAPKLNINFRLGDRVKVKEGTFESFEGEVSSIDQQSGRITVMINIFGRSTPVELEYWQAEQV